MITPTQSTMGIPASDRGDQRIDQGDRSRQAHQSGDRRGRSAWNIRPLLQPPLPAGMSDINCRWKTASGERPRQSSRFHSPPATRTCRIRPLREAAINRFDVLQAADQIEQTHRHNHRQISQPFLQAATGAHRSPPGRKRSAERTRAATRPGSRFLRTVPRLLRLASRSQPQQRPQYDRHEASG